MNTLRTDVAYAAISATYLMQCVGIDHHLTAGMAAACYALIAAAAIGRHFRSRSEGDTLAERCEATSPPEPPDQSD